MICEVFELTISFMKHMYKRNNQIGKINEVIKQFQVVTLSNKFTRCV